MHPPQPEPDRTLVLAVLAGDTAALDRWYRLEHPTVWRLALGVLTDPGAAEDLAQEAMLRLHDRLDRWDSERPYTRWRNTVVLNLCRDRLRRSAARDRAETAAAEDRAGRESLPPAAELEQGELRALIGQALGKLTPREREAFVLRELEGLPTKEVAAAMEIGESSLRSLLTLARRRLREFLGARLPETIGGEHA